MTSTGDKPEAASGVDGTTVGADPKTTYGLTKDAVAAVITLSSGILGISLTFSKNWAGDAASDDRWLLETSWILFLVSVVSGLLVMLVLTGISHEGGAIDSLWLRVPWIIQIVIFLAALIFFVVFGFHVIDDLKPALNPPVG